MPKLEHHYSEDEKRERREKKEMKETSERRREALCLIHDILKAILEDSIDKYTKVKMEALFNLVTLKPGEYLPSVPHP